MKPIRRFPQQSLWFRALANPSLLQIYWALSPQKHKSKPSQYALGPPTSNKAQNDVEPDMG